MFEQTTAYLNNTYSIMAKKIPSNFKLDWNEDIFKTQSNINTLSKGSKQPSSFSNPYAHLIGIQSEDEVLTKFTEAHKKNGVLIENPSITTLMKKDLKPSIQDQSSSLQTPFGHPPALYCSITLYFDSKTNLFLSFNSFLFVSAFKQTRKGVK